MPERTTDLRPSPKRGATGEVVVGVAAVLLGLLVPSSFWIDALRESPPELRDDLLNGMALSRAGLVLLGVFAILGWRWAWWRRGAEKPPARTVDWGRGDRVLLVILAVALVVRLIRLGEGLWLDEILALVDYYRLPLGEIVTTFQSENQHFTVSVLAHLSSAVFGESAWAIRLPVALFGVGCVWALYVFARKVASRREALLGSALLALSYHHVWFSQSARGYTAVLFFALIASWLFLRALEERRPRLWAWYAAAAALGVYSHLTMVFVVMSHVTIYAWMLCTRREEGWPQRWSPLLCGFTFATLLGFTLFGVGIPQFLNAALAEKSVVGAWKDPLWTLRETLSGFAMGGSRVVVVGLVGAVVLGVGVVSYARSRASIVAMLFLPAIFATAAALPMSHHLWPRTYFMVAGFGILVCVRGLLVSVQAVGGLLRPRAADVSAFGTAAVVVAIAVSAAMVPAAWGVKQDYEGVRAFVRADSAPGDAVVVVGLARFPFREVFAPEWSGAADIDELNDLLARGQRTLVIHSFPTHMATIHPEILRLLERDFELVRRFDGSLRDGQILVHRWTKATE